MFKNKKYLSVKWWRGSPRGTVDENPPANAGDIEVQSLVREDPTCCEATKSVRHNY